MAKTDALNIFAGAGSTLDKLKESYTSVIDQIQKSALSVQLKSNEDQLSGDPSSGSVEVRRLRTSVVRDLGTARGNSEGDAVRNTPVTVNLDVNKEIVEEISRFDLKLYGLPEMINRRSLNFSLAMARHLDTAFFAEAVDAGTEAEVSGTTLADEVESLIQTLETTTNDHVDGVDREMMDLSLTPRAYGLLENYIDTLPNPQDGGVNIEVFHKVRVHSNHRQTKEAVIMVRGAVAQPVAIVDFSVERIPLSPDDALSVFFKYGTEAVMPDLVYWADFDQVPSV